MWGQTGVRPGSDHAQTGVRPRSTYGWIDIGQKFDEINLNVRLTAV